MKYIFSKPNATYLKTIFIGQAERLDQVPCKPWLRFKVTKHLEGLIAVINDCVQSRTPFSCSLIGLAAFSFKLTVSAKKLFWTRAVVPNARGLTYFCAFSSILTRIVLAAAVYACDVTTWRHTASLKNIVMRWEICRALDPKLFMRTHNKKYVMSDSGILEPWHNRLGRKSIEIKNL